jgi:hypothetical protein
MKSVKLGTNTTAEAIHKSKHQHAQSVLIQAKAFVSELIPLEELEKDIEVFKQSFSGYVQTFIKNDKVLSKLSGIDHIINLAALQTLEKRYHEYKQPEQQNFDIFATTEQQVKAFEYSLNFVSYSTATPNKLNLGIN